MKKSIKIHDNKTIHGVTNNHDYSKVHISGHSKVYSIHEHSHEGVHSHVDGHSQGAGHSHTHKNTKVVLDRLSRASGHLESVKRMVIEGKDCSEVLIQLSAVIAALNNTGKVILKDHIENCIVEAVESGDKAALDNLSSAIDRFIK